MPNFDPVPQEYLLSRQTADVYIPRRFINTAEAEVTPREFSLQLLVDDEPQAQYEIGMFQRAAARDEPVDLFRLMKSTLEAGGGRHAQHMFIATALHPDRESLIDVTGVTRSYLEMSSRPRDETIFTVSAIGSLAMDAMLNVEENTRRAQAGDIHKPVARLL